MKTTYTLITILLLSTLLFNCSKKINSIAQNTQLQKYSQQLEMNYASTNNANDGLVENNQVFVSVDKPTKDISQPMEAKSTHKKTRLVNKLASAVAGHASIQVIKTGDVSVRPEKIYKNQKAKAVKEVTGKLKTGIILGAVGLILLITANFFGAAAPIIYVAGAVLFVIGVVFILISVL